MTSRIRVQHFDFLIPLLLLVGTFAAIDHEQDQRVKSPKFLNLITWVKFDNTECAATSGDNGTCFTSNECSEIGGTADGTCASGFGVCCILKVVMILFI